MREIKFRAYLEREGMEYIDDLYWFEENFVHNLLQEEHHRKYVIMQSTGLKDKKDKEIYEGDIIKFRGFEYHLYVITWESGGYIGRNGNEILQNQSLSVYRKRIEIIGNIYEGILTKYENTDILKVCQKELKDFKKDTKSVKKQE